ncbi:hypothetical protein StoSoilA2_43410 [Arthrobacter sp. StoSoilA2]|nr:hypothetical protein StoSoilA2_43410 [Arthrobacter sp. StoSoilA2]
MNVGDDVRAGVVEDFVAAFKILEVRVQGQFPVLQHGAHGAIGDDDALVHRIKKGLGTARAGDGINVKGKTGHIDRVRVGCDTARSVSVYYDGGWLPFSAGRCPSLASTLATNEPDASDANCRQHEAATLPPKGGCLRQTDSSICTYPTVRLCRLCVD